MTVDLADHRLEPQFAAERASRRHGSLQGCAVVPATGIVRTDDVMRVELAQGRGGAQHRGRVLRIEADAERRRKAAERRQSQSDGALAGGEHGAGVLRNAERDALPKAFAGSERVGPRQGEGADVGLVGGVCPVALILHLEGVALHAAGDGESRREGVRQRPQVHHRLHRIDEIREARLDRAPVDALHGARFAGDALDRVQHDETGAVREEVGRRLPVRLEGERAVRAAADRRAIDQALALVPGGGPVGNAEGVLRLLDAKVLDARTVGAPVPVAHDKGHGTQHLAAVKADIAQIAVLEFRRERPGFQHDWIRDRFLGSEQADRARGRLEAGAGAG